MRRLFSTRPRELKYKIPTLYCDRLLGEEIVKSLASVLIEDCSIFVEVYDGAKMIDSGNIHDIFNGWQPPKPL